MKTKKNKEIKAYERNGIIHVPGPDGGAEYQFTRTNRDQNGNPRYYVSFIALGLKTYVSTPVTLAAGLRKVKTKSFGGGFTFQSHNPLRTAEFFYSLGLYLKREPEADMMGVRSTLDKAIETAINHPTACIGASYVLQSLAHALRGKLKHIQAKGSLHARKVQIRQIEELVNVI